MNPYNKFPKSSFWKTGVTNAPLEDFDPVINLPFKINKHDLVSTMGSCFAQHMSKELVQNGFNYYIAEKAPVNISVEDAESQNYNVFSARYGNLYTVSQILQLYKRAFGIFEPSDSYWRSKTGAFIDPFRPQIISSGFDSLENLLISREVHLKAVRDVFQKSNIIVITLGLTEAWISTVDNAVFPSAPGVVSDNHDDVIYQAKNFSLKEVVDDLLELRELVKSVNPSCKFILTVSPVPLIATHQNEHVLQSTVYSKSVLRVAAKEVCDISSDFLYFPSFEIINSPSSHGKYFEEDLRTVNELGVSHVMRVLKNNLIDTDHNNDKLSLGNDQGCFANNKKVICDEEVIESALSKINLI